MKKINKIGNDLYRLVKFPYMENNFDSLNEYQELSKILAKINECVEKCNYIIDNTDAGAVKKQLDEIKLDIATYKEQLNENIANFENATNVKITDFQNSVNSQIEEFENTINTKVNDVINHSYFKNGENFRGSAKINISNFDDGYVSADKFEGEYIYNYSNDNKKLLLSFEVACTNLRVKNGQTTSVFLLQTPNIKRMTRPTYIFAIWRERYAGEYIAFSSCEPRNNAIEINIPKQVIDGNYEICSVQLLNGLFEEVVD